MADKQKPLCANDTKQIRKLSEENRRLKDENTKLKRELEEIKNGSTSLKIKKGNPSVALFEHQATNELLFSRKHYFGYFLEKVRHTSIFNLYRKFIAYLRRYKFITTSIKILIAVLAVIESSAVFVIATSFFVVSVPLMFFLSYAVIILSFFGARKTNALNKKIIGSKKVTVFFPTKEALRDDSFFRGMVLENAAAPDRVSVVVMPHFWKYKGLTGRKRPFIAARVDGERLIMVRHHYYFMMKRRVFKPLGSDITEIY